MNQDLEKVAFEAWKTILACQTKVEVFLQISEFFRQLSPDEFEELENLVRQIYIESGQQNKQKMN